MKKLLALAAAAVMVFSFSACSIGAGDVTSAGSGASAGTESAPTSAAPVPGGLSDTEVDDNLAGLQKYMESWGYVTGTAAEMKAGLIGAQTGVKYQFDRVVVELYEFNLDSLEETGRTTLDSVKQNNNFTILGKQVPAILSDNGKYLMTYTNGDSGDEAKAKAEKAAESFQSFKKG